MRWEPGAGELLEPGLDTSEGQGTWDQFSVNKALFGVQTSFDEDMYTTKLDKKTAGISEAMAARIEAEILSKNSTNYHINEERGLVVDDSGVSFGHGTVSSVAHQWL